MFDPRQEQPLTFAEASKLPWRRTRKGRPSVRTLHRWASKGKAGIRLECIRMGGERFTSEAAIVRFFQEAENPETLHTPVCADRAADVAEAKARLAALGI